MTTSLKMTYAIDICFTNASAAEFILYRLKLYLAGRHHHGTGMRIDSREIDTTCTERVHV